MNEVKDMQNKTDLSSMPCYEGLFRKTLDQMVKELGGYVNGHSHLDRAGTFDKKYFYHCGVDPADAATFSLRQKQVLMGELHKGLAYNNSEDLRERIKTHLDLMVATGVKEIVSFIDTSPDVGLIPLGIALELKEQYRKKIDFRIAAYPIFGFKDDPKYSKSRWEIFEEACKLADIIGALPEKDNRPECGGIIGEDAHFRRVINLGLELGKEVHIHVDQYNDPRQRQTLDFIEFIRRIVGEPKSYDVKPQFWAVHEISPSAYSEEAFKKVLDGSKRYHIGVKCCPKAAVGMNQLRSLNGPTRNSIARVFEMLFYGIRVEIGTDNISDIFIPTSNGSMLEELIELAEVLRFSHMPVLAKLGAGVPINRSDEEVIRRYLETYRETLVAANPDFKFCLDLK
ncbi:MAG: hypothetical protein HYW71_02090 [Candidatus Niyogibacteria bacterium]|nr:hypothetical protein [Candidatus Niyogibacteria bacterium]